MNRIIGLPILGFVVAAVYVPGIFSGTYMPKWWAMAILLPIVSNLDPRNLPRAVEFCLAAGLAWAAASIAWTPIPAEAAMNLGFMILLALAFIAAAGSDWTGAAVRAFGWGIVPSSVLCCLQAAGVPFDVPAVGTGGFFLNSEIMAEVAAPVAVWAIWRRQWFLAAAMVPPLALCHSRVALAAVCAGLLWGWRPRLAIIKAFPVLALTVAAVAAVGLVDAVGIAKVGSALHRVTLWLAGAESVTPLGRGLGWWAVAHPGPLEEFAHSDVLQLVIELGAGAAFFLTIPVLALAKGGGDVATRSAFVVICLESLVSFPLQLPATGFLAALLAGSMVGVGAGLRDRRLHSGADHVPRSGWIDALGGGMVHHRAREPRDLSFRPASAPDGDRGAAGLGRATAGGR